MKVRLRLRPLIPLAARVPGVLLCLLRDERAVGQATAVQEAAWVPLRSSRLHCHLAPATRKVARRLLAPIPVQAPVLALGWGAEDRRRFESPPTCRPRCRRRPLRRRRQTCMLTQPHPRLAVECTGTCTPAGTPQLRTAKKREANTTPCSAGRAAPWRYISGGSSFRRAGRTPVCYPWCRSRRRHRPQRHGMLPMRHTWVQQTPARMARLPSQGPCRRDRPATANCRASARTPAQLSPRRGLDCFELRTRLGAAAIGQRRLQQPPPELTICLAAPLQHDARALGQALALQALPRLRSPQRRG